MTIKRSPAEQAIERFAQEVVIRSIEDTVFEMERDLNSYFNDVNNSVLSSLLANKSDLEKMKIISSLAAELALATFFSNLDLNPNFEIKIEGEEDEWYDLADAYEIPLICSFDEDGWISQYSQLPSYLNQVDKQRENTNKPQGA